ncbi:MAG: hypothetical protein FWH11_14430 [Micrococcales bacterium]|nr:hypothetical protein [Micrococcales bacterium]
MGTTNSAGALQGPVVAVLDALSAQGWRMLHTTRWPGHPGHTIEHIAVGPGGVVVVSVPRPAVHDEALDGPQEDLSCATSAVTALVAPRHRRTVRGVLVVPPGTESPTRAPVVESDRLETWLTSLEQRLTPLEVVLVSAYLRDRLNPLATPRATQVPRPVAPAELPAAELLTAEPSAAAPAAPTAPAPTTAAPAAPAPAPTAPAATGPSAAEPVRRLRIRRRRRWWQPGSGTTTALVVAAGVVAPWVVAWLLHAF